MPDAADIYRQRLLEALLRVDGIKPVEGYTPEQVRRAGQALIQQYGLQNARLGLMGLAAQSIDRATATFVQTVLSYLWDLPAVPSGAQASVVAGQIKSALGGYHASMLTTAYAANRNVMVTVVGATQDALLGSGFSLNITVDNAAIDIQRRMQAARPGVKPFNVMFDNAFARTDLAVDKWIRMMQGAPVRDATARLFAELVGLHNMPGADTLGHRGEQIRRRMQSIGYYKEKLLDGYKPASSAKRIILSEMASMKQHSTAYMAAKSPATKYVQWVLSMRHPIIESSPDICDIYAHGNWHGAGNGLFRPENVPGHPHPFCACKLVPVVIQDTSQWSSDFGPPPEPTIPTQAQVSNILRHSPGPANQTRGRILRTTRNAAGDLRYANYRFNRMGV